MTPTFFTAIGCMDGRIQDAIRRYGRRKLDAEFADTITEAGFVSLNFPEPDNLDQYWLLLFRFKLLDVSLGRHHSKGVVVYGHSNCSGNAIPDDQHKQQILDFAKRVSNLADHMGYLVPVLAAFVHTDELEVEHLTTIVGTTPTPLDKSGHSRA